LPRFLRRDAGAEVERLYRRHSAEVLRYALLVLRSRSDAEDVTQAVFIRALGALERGEKVRTPRNWLIKIAHNECRRLVSSRKLHVELPEQLAAEPEESGRADELKRALAALPSAQRRALVLRELEGRSYNEIATTLSLSVSAVETLIFRARRSLREQLEGALSCEEFAGLLDDPDARARVRAHARICAECATLERQARGRKSALKRIASALGLPWWGAKVAAVALTTVTVAGVATVAVPRDHANQHPPTPVPRSVPVPVSLIPGGTGVTSFSARAHRPAVVRPKVSGARQAPGTSAASTRAGTAAQPPGAAVLPGSPPSATAPQASSPPVAALPLPGTSLPEPQVAVPGLTLPPLPVATPPHPVATPPLPLTPSPAPALPVVPAVPAVPAVPTPVQLAPDQPGPVPVPVPVEPPRNIQVPPPLP